MKAIIFESNSTQRVYDNYMRRAKKTVSGLSKDDRLDALMEINSHIYEGTRRDTEHNELEQLLDILDKLGDPEEVLKPLVAEKKLEQASRTFNPIHVFKAIGLNIGNGVMYMVFAMLYLFLFGFVFCIGAKIKYPELVGVYFKDGSFEVLGIQYNAAANGYTEVLGHWFIPVMIVATVLLYLLITLLLRLTLKR